MPQAPTPANNQPWLTPRQVAELLQVREFTVTLWLRRRLLRGVKFGKSWRIRPEALRDFQG